MRRLLAIFAAAAIGLSAAGLSATTMAKADDLANILSKGVVRIGVPIDVPPFGSQDASRNPVGLDVELAQMIGKALGVKVELQQITGANRIPYLLTNKIDIVIAALGMTPERAKQITYTNPYADTYDAVYGAKSAKVASAADLGNLKIAITKGTTQDIELTALNPKANFMRTEDDATAAAAYVSGQAELFATNSLIIPDLQKRNPDKEFELKFTIRRSPAHMGVRMGEHNLVRWLDSFIFFNMMNGEIDRLHQKYLGMKLAPLPSL